MATAPKPGFPEYGASDADIIFQCSCTSLTQVQAAAGGTGVVIGTGTPTFDSGGILLPVSTGINWTGLTTEQKAQLAIAGTLTCWIESGWNDYDGATNASYQFGPGFWDGSTRSSITKVANEIVVRGFIQNTNTGNYDTKPTGRDAYTRYDLSWHGNKTTLYLDGVRVSSVVGKKPQLGHFANFTIGGATSSPTPTLYYKIKDVMLSTRPIVPAVGYKTKHIMWSGHSYIQQADYPPAGPATEITGISYYNSTTPGTGPLQTSLNVSGVPMMHRELAQRGVFIGNDRIYNYGYGGKLLNDAVGGLRWQTTQALASNGTLDVVCLMWGANEVANMPTPPYTWAVNYGPGGSQVDWEAAYRTEIDYLLTKGAHTILISNVISFGPYNQNALNIAGVEAANVMVNSIVASYAQCHLVDCFNLFRGHNTVAADWGGFSGVDYVHPNLLMSGNIGKLFANKLLEVI